MDLGTVFWGGGDRWPAPLEAAVMPSPPPKTLPPSLTAWGHLSGVRDFRSTRKRRRDNEGENEKMDASFLLQSRGAL